MNNLPVEKLIILLKNEEWIERRNAAYELGKSGYLPAIPSLIAALKDENRYVRASTAAALAAFGSAATSALIEVFKDRDYHARGLAAYALGKIGEISAVPKLIETLKDKDRDVRMHAAGALHKIGDSITLPRKILSASCFTTQQRVDILEALRRARYAKGFINMKYSFPDTITLCESILVEEGSKSNVNVQEVLQWLKVGRYLLRPSQFDELSESSQLLRAVERTTPETQPETLLRASGEVRIEN